LWGIIFLHGTKPVATQFFATNALASSDAMRTENRPTREGANVTIARQLQRKNPIRRRPEAADRASVLFGQLQKSNLGRHGGRPSLKKAIERNDITKFTF
jgi:hypothetical protein